MALKVVEVTADGVGDNTGWLSPSHSNPKNTMDLSIESDSAWDGTIELQKTRDGGATIHTVQSYVGDAQEYIEDDAPGVLYRLFCTAFSAGSADLELYREK